MSSMSLEAKLVVTYTQLLQVLPSFVNQQHISSSVCGVSSCAARVLGSGMLAIQKIEHQTFLASEAFVKTTIWLDGDWKYAKGVRCYKAQGVT